MPTDLSGIVEKFRQRLRRHERLVRRLNGDVYPDDACGGNPTRPWESFCDATWSFRVKPTWRCRWFGCKPIPASVLKFIRPRRCDCPAGLVYDVPNATAWGQPIHIGCCVRCGQPIIPSAKALKASR